MFNFSENDWDMEVKSKVPFVCQDTVLSYAVSPKVCREEVENAMGTMGRDFDGRLLPQRVFVYITPGEIVDIWHVGKQSAYVGVGYVFKDEKQLEAAGSWFAGYEEKKVDIEINPLVGYARGTKKK